MRYVPDRSCAISYDGRLGATGGDVLLGGNVSGPRKMVRSPRFPTSMFLLSLAVSVYLVFAMVDDDGGGGGLPRGLSNKVRALIGPSLGQTCSPSFFRFRENERLASHSRTHVIVDG